MNTSLQKTQATESFLSKDNIDHYLKLASLISKTDMTPKAYKNKPNDILVAMELGRSWGLSPLQAIQNIAVINGKPCAYGDLVLAICSSHPDFEDIKEEPIIEGEKVAGYKCTIKRKNRTPVVRSFTVEQAEKANLLGKNGTWSTYPQRMMQMRARAFALRDSFADALNGVAIREEVEDYEIKDITPKLNPDSLLNKIDSDKSIDEKTETNVSRETSINENSDAGVNIYQHLNELIEETKLPPARLEKAFSFYNASTVEELSENSAHMFAQQLEKIKERQC